MGAANDTIAELEPAAVRTAAVITEQLTAAGLSEFPLDAAAQLSALSLAISAKRIADTLEKVVDPYDRQAIWVRK